LIKILIERDKRLCLAIDLHQEKEMILQEARKHMALMFLPPGRGRQVVEINTSGPCLALPLDDL
jgi:hypothetical protein